MTATPFRIFNSDALINEQPQAVCHAAACHTIHRWEEYTMSDSLAGKYLTFILDNEEYGIALLKVKEIIGMMPITTVPQTPEYVKGVINLRGKVIPVSDLRLRFGMSAADYTDRTCIIVVEIQGEAATIQIGIVVDAVSEVMNIKAEEVEEAPSFGTKVETDYILGMANMDGQVKILLDIDRVLTDDAMAKVPHAA
jgi:purine-binding chemotaxis protein CheW